MAREPRVDVAGIHHVYARGNARGLIFRDDVDRVGYLGIVGLVVKRLRWHCLAYCLMDNHVHLLVEIPEANLGRGMQRLHGMHGQAFNERHRRCGHVFQGRYGSTLVTSDEQLWWAFGYIARNPVEAGLCATPGDWPWSSHGAARRGAAPAWLDTPRLTELFSRAGGDPVTRYAELVGD